MKIKKFYLIVCFGIALTAFNSCKKDENVIPVDLRDQITGTYNSYGITQRNFSSGEIESSESNYESNISVVNNPDDNKSILIYFYGNPIVATNIRENNGKFILDVDNQYNLAGSKIEGGYTSIAAANDGIIEIFSVSFGLNSDFSRLDLYLYTYNENQTDYQLTSIWLGHKE
jgi:nitrous oxide reductase accessory protein NosL